MTSCGSVTGQAEKCENRGLDSISGASDALENVGVVVKVNGGKTAEGHAWPIPTVRVSLMARAKSQPVAAPTTFALSQLLRSLPPTHSSATAVYYACIILNGTIAPAFLERKYTVMDASYDVYLTDRE